MGKCLQRLAVMKSDRLYGITLYLLNHKRASARELATYFEVSLRSIQRDIDTLCMANVPIVAYSGVQGGYEIQESFKMQAQLIHDQEYAIIEASLYGYASAVGTKDIQTMLHKMKTLSNEEYPIQLDFSIANEKTHIVSIRNLLQHVLQTKKQIQMSYTNASDIVKTIICEPVILLYRWYAWYVIAYDVQLKVYHMYKLQRMEDISILRNMQYEHPPMQVILEEIQKEDHRTYQDITMYCRKECRMKILEYIQGEIIQTYDNGDFLYHMLMPNQEFFWYACILGMGANVEVLEPLSLRERIQKDCKNMLVLYTS